MFRLVPLWLFAVFTSLSLSSLGNPILSYNPLNAEFTTVEKIQPYHIYWHNPGVVTREYQGNKTATLFDPSDYNGFFSHLTHPSSTRLNPKLGAYFSVALPKELLDAWSEILQPEFTATIRNYGPSQKESDEGDATLAWWPLGSGSVLPGVFFGLSGKAGETLFELTVESLTDDLFENANPSWTALTKPKPIQIRVFSQFGGWLGLQWRKGTGSESGSWVVMPRLLTTPLGDPDFRYGSEGGQSLDTLLEADFARTNHFPIDWDWFHQGSPLREKPTNGSYWPQNWYWLDKTAGAKGRHLPYNLFPSRGEWRTVTWEQVQIARVYDVFDKEAGGWVSHLKKKDGTLIPLHPGSRLPLAFFDPGRNLPAFTTLFKEKVPGIKYFELSVYEKNGKPQTYWKKVPETSLVGGTSLKAPPFRIIHAKSLATQVWNEKSGNWETAHLEETEPQKSGPLPRYQTLETLVPQYSVAESFLNNPTLLDAYWYDGILAFQYCGRFAHSYILSDSLKIFRLERDNRPGRPESSLNGRTRLR